LNEIVIEEIAASVFSVGLCSQFSVPSRRRFVSCEFATRHPIGWACDCLPSDSSFDSCFSRNAVRGREEAAEAILRF
jgi:hypothetical protein